jgi:GntR family transcriptional regulator/MocR family aminotransferase
MSEEKKRALIKWASDSDSFVIEDDYDGEFWMSSDAPKALAALPHNGRVIYMNSFSKTLFPSLRISYMVVPESITADLATLKSIYDPYPSSLAQITLSEFIGSGAFSAHLREMRTVYRERNGFLRQVLRQILGNRVTLHEGQYGLHLCAHLDSKFDDVEVADRMKADGFGVNALSSYFLTDFLTEPPENRNGIVMGYAGWDSPALRKAVIALDKICR